jgi:hypothetical protein
LCYQLFDKQKDATKKLLNQSLFQQRFALSNEEIWGIKRLTRINPIGGDKIGKRFNKKARPFNRAFGWLMGIEPTTLRTTI